MFINHSIFCSSWLGTLAFLLMMAWLTQKQNQHTSSRLNLYQNGQLTLKKPCKHTREMDSNQKTHIKYEARDLSFSGSNNCTCQSTHSGWNNPTPLPCFEQDFCIWGGLRVACSRTAAVALCQCRWKLAEWMCKTGIALSPRVTMHCHLSISQSIEPEADA